MSPIKSPEEVREQFRNTGVSVAHWARVRGFNLPLVYSVLHGRSRALRGESHRIAVALGLRTPPDPADSFNLLEKPAQLAHAEGTRM